MAPTQKSPLLGSPISRARSSARSWAQCPSVILSNQCPRLDADGKQTWKTVEEQVQIRGPCDQIAAPSRQQGVSSPHSGLSPALVITFTSFRQWEESSSPDRLGYRQLMAIYSSDIFSRKKEVTVCHPLRFWGMTWHDSYLFYLHKSFLGKGH